MKRIATLTAMAALMLSLGVANVYAQHAPVTMSFSGTSVPSMITIQPGVVSSEYDLAGRGALGAFTFRTVESSDQPPGACPAADHSYAGAGVIRFEDGSMVMVNLTQGSDCLDFSAAVPVAHCTRTFQITGGTGRFKNLSSGTITLTETVLAVLFDASNNPVLFAATGELTGTGSSMAMAAESRDARQ